MYSHIFQKLFNLCTIPILKKKNHSISYVFITYITIPKANHSVFHHLYFAVFS